MWSRKELSVKNLPVKDFSEGAGCRGAPNDETKKAHLLVSLLSGVGGTILSFTLLDLISYIFTIKRD